MQVIEILSTGQAQPGHAVKGVEQIGIHTQNLAEAAHISLAREHKVREGFRVEKIVTAQQSQRPTDPIAIAGILHLVRTALQPTQLSRDAPSDELVSPPIFGQNILGLSHERECRYRTKRTSAMALLSGEEGYGSVVRSAASNVINGPVYVHPRPVIEHVRYGAGTEEESHVVLAPEVDALEASVVQLQLL